MRRVFSLIIASVLVGLTATPALSISGAISPSYQSRAYGQTAIWGAAWGQTAPYDVTWRYGDGTTWTRTNTTLTSQGFSRAFTPCQYSKTYYQSLDVKERPTGATLRANASTYVSAKPPPCPFGSDL